MPCWNNEVYQQPQQENRLSIKDRMGLSPPTVIVVVATAGLYDSRLESPSRSVNPKKSTPALWCQRNTRKLIGKIARPTMWFQKNTMSVVRTVHTKTIAWTTSIISTVKSKTFLILFPFIKALAFAIAYNVQGFLLCWYSMLPQPGTVADQR